MKVAIIHWAFAYSGGGERVALGWLKHLDEATCFTGVVNQAVLKSFDFHPSQQQRRIRQLLPIPFTPRVGYILGMLLPALLSPLLVRRLRGYDVLIASGAATAFLAFLAKRRYGSRVLIYLYQPNRFLYPRKIDREADWVHESFALAFVSRVVRAFSWLIRAIDRTSVIQADMVLADSHHTKKRVDRIYSVNSRVLVPGVETEGRGRQDMMRATTTTTTAAHGNSSPTATITAIPDKTAIIILTSSRHQPQKGLDLLLRAMAHVKKVHPEAVLYMTGKRTTYTGQLASLASKLGIAENVVFTGLLNDRELGDVFRRARVYAFSPTDEDFGLGPVEAMAHGVPVVAWNAGGPAETVRNGETGFLVPVGDVGAFAKAICALLDDGEGERLSHSMSQRAVEVVRQYDWKEHIRKLRKVMTEEKGAC